MKFHSSDKNILCVCISNKYVESYLNCYMHESLDIETFKPQILLKKYASLTLFKQPATDWINNELDKGTVIYN